MSQKFTVEGKEYSTLASALLAALDSVVADTCLDVIAGFNNQRVREMCDRDEAIFESGEEPA